MNIQNFDLETSRDYIETAKIETIQNECECAKYTNFKIGKLFAVDKNIFRKTQSGLRITYNNVIFTMEQNQMILPWPPFSIYFRVLSQY